MPNVLRGGGVCSCFRRSLLLLSVSTKCVCVLPSSVLEISWKTKRDLLRDDGDVCSAQVPGLCRVISANMRLFFREVKITIRRG